MGRGDRMRRLGHVLAAPMLALLLGGCNTSDALTPRVDVGGGLRPSAPVSQADANRMASTPDGQAGYRSDQSAPLAPPATGPQNSLEAQARAIEDGGRSSVASTPLAPPPATGAQSAQASPPPVQQQSTTQQTAVVTPQQPAETASATIRFLPIIGAPVQAVTPLSRQLGASARAAGLTIKPSADASSEHIIKGYLSAFEDGQKVTVVYVWDVLDGSGARLHRIQGQETAPIGTGDPWAAVPTATMQSIGQKTIQEYMRWRQTQSG
jgi:hypothetical protein